MSRQHRGPGIVIAIDGPSGAGKSSTSRRVAQARGARYLDTGAMYRAMTWWMLEHGVDPADPAAVAKRVAEPVLTIGTDPGAPGIEVDGADVAEAIRSEQVTSKVSAVAAVPEVRERMVADQRGIIVAACRGVSGIVVEGRDIATAVAPDAEVKIYLTASPGARAQRRSAETDGGVAATRKALAQRDQLDTSRAASPLQRTDEAVEVDTTGYTLQQVVDLVTGLAEEAERQAAAH